MTADRRDWVEVTCPEGCGWGVRVAPEYRNITLASHFDNAHPEDESPPIVIKPQNSGEEKKPCWDCGRSDEEQTPCCSGCLEASVSPSKATIEQERFLPRLHEAMGLEAPPLFPSTKKTILEEAGELVDGPREAHYGHPYDDGTKFIGAFNALFKDYLSKPLEVKHWPLMMILVKLSREIHESKRDNIVDAAGYARVIEKILEREQELEDQIDAGEYK